MNAVGQQVSLFPLCCTGYRSLIGGHCPSGGVPDPPTLDRFQPAFAGQQSWFDHRSGLHIGIG
jgi:hypothetical protein